LIIPVYLLRGEMSRKKPIKTGFFTGILRISQKGLLETVHCRLVSQ
jgi:hypothetical protein